MVLRAKRFIIQFGCSDLGDGNFISINFYLVKKKKRYGIEFKFLKTSFIYTYI